MTRIKIDLETIPETAAALQRHCPGAEVVACYAIAHAPVNAGGMDRALALAVQAARLVEKDPQ